ncbi:FAD dependent oxidoreductase-domain-containing protein [Macrophomina phaseolina]|uniref:FAD dependent oxidoreductase-domain-containing protein n=1 Tax=Macrophomina phaseolina TaxID=35725 RepID=A0ABQ8GWF5_9PEZI|nr:FAD dependent oxidoreductase-domain-containing protein [Macrophomina phaseolina]
MTASSRPPNRFLRTNGENDSVWTHALPYAAYPSFPQLSQDLSADVCVIGSGIAGVSTAYELVRRGHDVVLLEARDVVSGETGRTSGHLTNDLDDGYVEIATKHGDDGARIAAESHGWALRHVGDVAGALGIDCEYRRLPAVEISQYPRGDPKHDDEIKSLREEAEKVRAFGMDMEVKEGYAVKGWEGAIDQRDAAIVKDQATFHPTKYVCGVLRWLKEQPNFKAFTRTRMVDVQEHGVEVLGFGNKTVEVKTLAGPSVKCGWAVEATAVPLQKLSVVAEMEYHRSYCIAIRVPKGKLEDCLLYDQADAYKYVRLTACDEMDDYAVVGGCDHKVGQEDTTTRFGELEQWFRERFPSAGEVDYRWSGQIWEPVDFLGFIGLNPHKKRTFIVTGDSGDGLTHGVLAGALIADEIDGKPNPWAKLYDPSRSASIAKALPQMLQHDVQINTQYKRLLQSDIQDIEDLGKGEGGVLNPKTSKPLAVYRDETGKVHRFSALCPHMKGVVCWNTTEKSWDCPVHGSRFSKEGVCVTGPAKMGLNPEDEASEAQQKETREA